MNKFKKVSMSLLVGVFLFTSIFGSLSFVKPVYATGIPVLDTIAQADRLAAKIVKKVEKITENLKEKINVAITQAMITVASNFVQKISYDLAMYAASGGKGQGAMAFNKGFKSYIEEVGDNAAGELIDQLGKPFGLNLCKPPDLGVDLTIRLGLKSKYGAPAKPKCTFSSFKKNWKQMGDPSSQYYKDQAENFNVAFKPGQSDFGFAMEADIKVDKLSTEAVEGKTKEREEGQGAKPLTNMIAGDIKSPAQTNLQNFKKMSPVEQSAAQSQRMDAMFSTGDGSLIQFGGAVFFNTFISQVFKNLMKGQLFGYDFLADGGGSALDTGYSGAGLTNVGKKEAREYFRYLITPITKTMYKYNSTLMANFKLCDSSNSSMNSRGQENCVADDDWSQLVGLADSGDPMTIGQAVNEDYLDGTKKLFSPTSDESKSPNCYEIGYCYYNLKKMRQARIVPLGFELAALLSPDDDPVSLDDVLAGFDQVGTRYYHLLDPNWVIKLPDSKCNNYGYTSLLYGNDLGVRMQECVDLQSCVGVDSSGDCSNYGYCTREKNIWSFDFDRCEPQNDSCQTYTNTTNKNTFSYLYKTLDSKYCDSENIGCRGYDIDRNRDGDWANGITSTIYLNKNVEECSSSDDGCSAFKVVFDEKFLNIEDTEDPVYLYLNKAPNYLGCYDSGPATLDGDWPVTKSDLVRINYNEECENYAGICIPEEEGCNMFSPLTYLGEDIPAKFNPAVIENDQITWNDQCDATCVGYNSYREMPNNYSSGQDLAYIIPSTAETCSVAEEGCSSFTNLSTTVGQIENIEYYSYLRPCILPDQTKQKKYITYENSSTGYQLKVYLLEQDLMGETGKVGAPKYFYKTLVELDDYNEACNEGVYWKGLTHPDWNSELSSDCRQFNDDEANVYYRLLSKTIAVSDECTGYRKNIPELYVEAVITDQADCINKFGFWDGSSCQLCYQNGEYKDGFCIYNGLPGGVGNSAGVSSACSAEVESCTAYKGNAGNNVRELVSDDFENSSTTVALSGWSAQDNISLSNESTQMNGHSLYYRASSHNILSKNIAEEKFELEGNYSLTFWAKGIGEADIYLAGKTYQTDNQIGNLVLTDNWREYKFNLNKFVIDDLTTSTIEFYFSDTGDVIYLDNVSLVEVSEYLYLVKNTLSVPEVCDSNLNDNLPGEALGCAAYSDINDKDYYLNNFSYLCREEAVGCTALVDTYNTIEATADSSGNIKGEDVERFYNVSLERTNGNINQIDNRSIEIGVDEYKCIIQKGENECFVNIFGHGRASIEGVGGNLDNAYYIPADNTTSTPIYLVVNENAYCSAQNKGCMEVGLQGVGLNVANVFEGVFIKNNPDLYEAKNLLCNYLGSGCDEYTSGDGNNYFKDPALMQAGICEYKTNITTQYGSRTGWFRQGVGVCSSTPSLKCTSNAECGFNDMCIKKGTIPCYSNYISKDGSYGILPSGSVDYDNLVGECPASESGCTKYLDHNDSDSYDNPEEYYFLEQSVDVGEDCEGKVSINYGCILLDKTDNPTKMYNTTSTYQDSAENEYNLVKPANSNNNDANIIVSAIKDRECAEWLYCNVARMDEDDNTGQPVKRCYSLGSCNESNNSMLGCANDNTYRVLNRDDGSFSISDYKERDISWNGFDYSGYTIFDLDFTQQLQANSLPSPENITSTQILTEFVRNYSQKSTEELKVLQTCRSYPEETSPYLRNVLQSDPYIDMFNIFEYSAGFANSKLFSNVSTTIDDCSYVKGVYGDEGGVEAYWSLDGDDDGSYVCNYGVKKGKGCESDEDCCIRKELTEDHPCACVPITKKEIHRGVSGICMEQDGRFEINNTTNNACMTWLPVDQPKGSGDIYLEGTNVISEYVLPNDNQDRYICLYNEAPLLDDYIFDNSLPFPYTEIKWFSAGEGKKYRDDFECDDSEGCADWGRYVFPNFFADDQRYNLTKSSPEGSFMVEPKKRDYVNGVMLYDAGYRHTTGTLTGIPDILNKKYWYTLKAHNEYDQVVNFVPLMQASEVSGGTYEAKEPKPLKETIYKDDIERIEVYMDDSGNFPSLTPGLLVFDRQRLELEEPMYEKDDNPITTYVSDFSVDDDLPIGAKDFSAWTWLGYDKNVELEKTDFFGTNLNGYNRIEAGIINPYESLNDERIYRWVGQKEQGLGIRILFDDEDKLHGFHLAMIDHSGGDAEINLFFILYTTNGPCKVVAKVWDGVEGGKPYAANLIEDSHNLFTKEYTGSPPDIIPKRVKDNIYLDYGLVASSFSPTTSGKMWVDPFNYLDSDRTNWWYDNLSNRPLSGFDKYTGGVPLVNFRYGNRGEPVLDWGCYDGAGRTFRTTYDANCDFLAKMFAKIYGVWEWSDSSGEWVEKVAANPAPASFVLGEQLAYDISSAIFTDPNYPKFSPSIDAVDDHCSNGEQYCVGETKTFSINGKNSQDVVLSSSEEVVFRFYMTAVSNQMPIKRVLFNTHIANDIDVDLITMKGSFPNYKPTCDNPSHFGDGEGCVAEPVQIYTRYPCDVTNLIDFATGVVDQSKWSDLSVNQKYSASSGMSGYVKVGEEDITTGVVGNGLVNGDIVCVYNPRIQVMDNWGWCTGVCPYKDSGCYNGEYFNDCDNAKTNIESTSWTKFNGRLIVVPNLGSQGSNSTYDPITNF